MRDLPLLVLIKVILGTASVRKDYSPDTANISFPELCRSDKDCGLQCDDLESRGLNPEPIDRIERFLLPGRECNIFLQQGFGVVNKNAPYIARNMIKFESETEFLDEKGRFPRFFATDVAIFRRLL